MTPAPVSARDRIETLDVLRGFALLGIILVSPLWLARFRFGPAEWLWRSLTYGERQPFRRT